MRILQDEVAYQGPLGGLVTALAETTDEWMLAVAADMPHLTPEVIRALWDLRDDADAVVPVTEKGLEPLLALYRVEACLPAAREMLATGRRRPVAVFGRVKTVQVPADALRSVDPGPALADQRQHTRRPAGCARQRRLRRAALSCAAA